MKYTTLIFDMGNVILDFAPDYLLSRYTQDLEEMAILRQAIFFSDHWRQLDLGTLSVEAFAKQLNENVPPRLSALAYDILTTWHHHLTQKHDMVPIIKELHQRGYKLILCSNAALSFHSYKDTIEAFRYFDDLIISADILLEKPAPDIFHHLLQKHDLKASECLFVDDVIANIRGAMECGIDGYWFNGNAALFKEYLMAVGVL